MRIHFVGELLNRKYKIEEIGNIDKDAVVYNVSFDFIHLLNRRKLVHESI